MTKKAIRAGANQPELFLGDWLDKCLSEQDARMGAADLAFDQRSETEIKRADGEPASTLNVDEGAPPPSYTMNPEPPLSQSGGTTPPVSATDTDVKSDAEEV